MSQFADGLKSNTTFIVKNNSTNKRVTIFGQPIGPGNSYDLLGIPGVDEAEIKGSLLKGVLSRKLRNNEISVISTDLDLTTFNIPQLSFLTSKNINTKGTDWTTQTSWYFSTTGDDAADGLTPSTPIKTLASWRKRIGAGMTLTPVKLASSLVTLNFAAGFYDESLNLTGIHGAILILGTEQILASGTLSSFTNIDRTSQTGWARVATAAFDFTPHLKRFGVITNGSFPGARFIIESIPGANQAVITCPATQAAVQSATLTERVIAGTETFDIRIPATFFRDFICDSADLVVASVTDVDTTLFYSLAYLGFTQPAGASLILHGVSNSISSCKLDVKGDGLGGFSATALTTRCGAVSAPTFAQCIIGAMTLSGIATSGENLCCHFGVVSIFGNGSFVAGQDTMFSDCTIAPIRGSVSLGNILWHNTTAGKHAFDSTAVPFTPGSGVSILLQAGGKIYGSLLGANSDVFKLGSFTQVKSTDVIPIVAPGAGGVAVRFGSTTKTFAQLTPNGYMDIVAGAQTAGENGSMWLP